MLQIFILQIVYSLKLFPLFWKLNKITTTESAFLHVKTVQIFTTHRVDKLTFDLSLTFPVYSFFLKWSCCFINICWIKIFWIVLFIFLIKCCIFIGYEFTYLQNWLTKSIENWLTSKNITLLRSNVNLFCGPSARPGLCCETWGHLLVSLKFKRRPLLTANVPHNHRLVVTPGEQQTPLSIPG